MSLWTHSVWAQLYIAANAVVTSLATGTWTLIQSQYDGVRNCVGGGVVGAIATGLFTVAEEGYYKIQYKLALLGTTTKSALVCLYKNDAAIDGTETTMAAVTNALTNAVTGEAIVYANIGDTFSLYATSGQAANDWTLTDGTVTVERVG